MKRLLVQIVCQDWSSIGIGFISAVTHKTKRIGDMKLSNLLYHKVRDESHYLVIYSLLFPALPYCADDDAVSRKKDVRVLPLMLPEVVQHARGKRVM